MTEAESHLPKRIWQERPGEFSYSCSCGVVAKHQMFGDWNDHSTQMEIER